MAPLYIVKIGGSLITNKQLKTISLNNQNIERISEEISKAYSKNKFRLILVNGAGSYGHVLANYYRLNEGLKDKSQLRGLALTQALVNDLNANFCRALIKYGLPAYPMQAGVVMQNHEINSFNTSVIKHIMGLGLVPILYGTTAYDEKLGCSILSGDYIVAYLAKKMKADKVIFASDVDGLYIQNKLAKKLAKGQLKKLIVHISASKNIDVTGGMLGKVNHILSLKDLKCYIVNGSKKNRLYNCMMGRPTIYSLIEL